MEKRVEELAVVEAKIAFLEPRLWSRWCHIIMTCMGIYFFHMTSQSEPTAWPVLFACLTFGVYIITEVDQMQLYNLHLRRVELSAIINVSKS